MKVADFRPAEFSSRLRATGVTLETGPFRTRISSDIPHVAEGLYALYAGHDIGPDDGFADFHVSVRPPTGPRRWLRRQSAFESDGFAPFAPFPYAHALPLLEWGLNWLIGTGIHTFLVLHAACVEKDGRAVILPGAPGSGKSTLCAALVSRGWRLLSDEFGLVGLNDGRLTALARPVSLKNASIAIVKKLAPGAVFSREIADTHKGTIAFMAPPAESVARAGEAAEPALVVFPEYRAGAAVSLRPEPKAAMCIGLGENGFNYSILGLAGFEALSRLVDRCAGFRLTFGTLDDAVAAVESL